MKKRFLGLFLCVALVAALGFSAIAAPSAAYEYRGGSLSKTYDGQPVVLDLSKVYTNDNFDDGMIPLAQTGLYGKYIEALYRTVGSEELTPCRSEWTETGEVVYGPSEPGQYEFLLMRPENWEDDTVYETIPFAITGEDEPEEEPEENRLAEEVVATWDNLVFFSGAKTLSLGKVEDIPSLVFHVNDRDEVIPLTFYGMEKTETAYILTGAPFCPAEESVLTLTVANGKVASVKVEGFPDNEHVTYTILKGTYVIKPNTETKEEVETPAANEVLNITGSLQNNSLNAAVSGNLETALNVTAAEKAEGVWVWMELSQSTSEQVDADDAAKITASLAETDTVGLYLNIDLYKQTASGAKDKVSELGEAVTISVVVPPELRAQGRTFVIKYTHNGGAAVTIRPESYDPATGTLTFQADKFSTYALVYSDPSSSSSNGSSSQGSSSQGTSSQGTGSNGTGSQGSGSNGTGSQGTGNQGAGSNNGGSVDTGDSSRIALSATVMMLSAVLAAGSLLLLRRKHTDQ